MPARGELIERHYGVRYHVDHIPYVMRTLGFSVLKPALEDQRQVRIDYGAGGVNEGRVCDHALFAILEILDEDSWTAFQ